MAIFLNVFRIIKNSKVKLGTIEVGITKPPLLYFEWRGTNGTDDGGKCDWVKNDHNFYVLRLTSNRDGKTVGDISDDSWEPQNIPPEPYFKPGAEGAFWYYGPTQRVLIAKFERM